MCNILKKEMKLSAFVLSYFFIAFGFMFFLPGYPILCGPFFVCLGIFQSFRNYVLTNDIVFSALLPISKKDIVKGKLSFVLFIEFCSFVVMTIATILRMTIFANSEIYRTNALMNANFFALCMALVIFGLFNLIFITGFFKTTYKLTWPFILSGLVTFAVMIIAESLHYIPNLEGLNSFGFDNILLQLVSLLIGILLFAILSIIAFYLSYKNFEKVDL